MYVNIGAAKTRLSELVAVAMRGEDVVLDNAGAPQVRLVPVVDRTLADREAIVRRRLNTLGIWEGRLTEDHSIIPHSMTDKEIEDRWYRKFGPAA